MTQQKNKIARVFISFRLEGEEAEKFLTYKKSEFIKNTAEAARKLMFERLHQKMEMAQHEEVHSGKTK